MLAYGAQAFAALRLLAGIPTRGAPISMTRAPVPPMTAETIETIELPDVGPIRVQRRVCPQCGRDNQGVPPRHSRAPWDVVACQDCSFVYLDKAPVYDELFETMAWRKNWQREEKRRKKARPLSYKASKMTRWRLHLFPRKQVDDLVQRHVPGGNVIDIGCALGGRLKDMPQQYTPFGIEIESASAAEADKLFRTRGGRAVNASSLDGLGEFEDGFFQAATLRAYLEHEVQPREVMAEISRTLSPGGVAVIKVPNYSAVMRPVMGLEWAGFRFPDHVNYFTPASLRRMVEGVGLEVRRFGFMDRLPTSDNMWMVAGKR